MNKTIYILLIPLLLISCGTNQTSISLSTSEQISEDNPSISPSNEDIGETIYCASLNGLKNDGDTVMEFINAGWSMAGGIIDDNQFKISYRDGTGFIKCPKFDNEDDSSIVDIKMHLTNFNTASNTVIGKTLAFKVEAINSTDEDNVVETHQYSHVITQKDYDNKAPYLIPQYSSDFSSGFYRIKFLSKYNRIKITMTSRVEESSSKGCNLAINEIKISKTK
jgi:hypothetical protein